jgi:hypothetical protein
MVLRGFPLDPYDLAHNDEERVACHLKNGKRISETWLSMVDNKTIVNPVFINAAIEAVKGSDHAESTLRSLLHSNCTWVTFGQTWSGLIDEQPDQKRARYQKAFTLPFGNSPMNLVAHAANTVKLADPSLPDATVFQFFLEALLDQFDPQLKDLNLNKAVCRNFAIEVRRKELRFTGVEPDYSSATYKVFADLYVEFLRASTLLAAPRRNPYRFVPPSTPASDLFLTKTAGSNKKPTAPQPKFPRAIGVKTPPRGSDTTAHPRAKSARKESYTSIIPGADEDGKNVCQKYFATKVCFRKRADGASGCPDSHKPVAKPNPLYSGASEKILP